MAHIFDGFRWGVNSNGQVRAGGLDVGSDLREIARNGSVALWHHPGFMAWNGNYSPRRYEPTRYVLVEWLDGGGVRVVEEVEPGRNWRRERERLLARVALGEVGS